MKVVFTVAQRQRLFARRFLPQQLASRKEAHRLPEQNTEQSWDGEKLEGTVIEFPFPASHGKLKFSEKEMRPNQDTVTYFRWKSLRIMQNIK